MSIFRKAETEMRQWFGIIGLVCLICVVSILPEAGADHKSKSKVKTKSCGGVSARAAANCSGFASRGRSVTKSRAKSCAGGN